MENLIEVLTDPSKVVNSKIKKYLLKTAEEENISGDQLGIYININNQDKLSFLLFKDKKFFRKINLEDIINT